MSFWSKLAGLFTGRARRAIDTVAELVPKALPYLDLAAQIAAGITPTLADDRALDRIHAKFPRLFDGTLKTGSEVKLYMLAIAGELLEQQFPKISTTMARLAVEAVYLQKNPDAQRG